jgi:hypothetical protein
VRYFAFGDGFLSALAERVKGRHQLEATVVGALERLDLVVDGEPASTPVVRL